MPPPCRSRFAVSALPKGNGRRLFVFFAAIGLGLLSSAWGQLSSNQQKAGVIGKLPSYVSDSNGDGKITIGFLGGSSIKSLAAAVAGGRATVISIGSASDAARCDIVFVSSGSQGSWRSYRSSAPAALSVGESSGFAASGGILMLIPSADGLRLSYSKSNYAAARSAGLKLSSRLLRLATAVD